MLRLVPEVGFKFVVHDQFKIMFAPAEGGPLGVLERLAAGAATGGATVRQWAKDHCFIGEEWEIWVVAGRRV